MKYEWTINVFLDFTKVSETNTELGKHSTYMLKIMNTIQITEQYKFSRKNSLVAYN